MPNDELPKKRPTIEELEKILSDPTPRRIEVRPDGSIYVGETKEVTNLRNELAASEAARKELAVTIANLNNEIEALKGQRCKEQALATALERDKARLDWLQKVYTNDLKRNPEAPFGMLSVVLDWNYNQLRNAIDAAMEAQGTK